MYDGGATMGRKPDIRQEEFLPWDQFDRKSPDHALPAIYDCALKFSTKCRDWYWTSIRNKRLVSTASRFFTFLLAAFGVVAPLAAAIWSADEDKLLWTQLAVIALAAAGLVQLADRVFGWSSGWLRYISTVTAMENLTRQFQLEWAVHFVNLEHNAQDGGIRPLFDLAQRLQTQLGELQTSETDGWIVEFNAGRAMLNEVIKSAREAAEKSATEARSASQALSKASTPGAIELTATTDRRPLPSLVVALDGGPPEACKGLSWVRLKVEPGLHQVVVQATQDNTILSETTRVVEVPPGAPARVTVEI